MIQDSEIEFLSEVNKISSYARDLLESALDKAKKININENHDDISETTLLRTISILLTAILLFRKINEDIREGQNKIDFSKNMDRLINLYLF